MAITKINSKIPMARAEFARLALVALFAGAITIGFAPIFVRLSQIGPVATAFWRITLALPFLWLGVILENRNSTASRRPSARADYLRLVAAGLFFTCDLALWHWAIKFTLVANATLLNNVTPVFVTLAAWLIFKQRVTLTFILGMAAALTGAAMLIGTSFNLSLHHFLGDMLALTAAVFYAGYLLSIKELRYNFSPPTIMAWSGTVTALGLLAAALLSGETFLPVTPQGWLPLLGLALLVHVGGQGMITYAMAHLPAAFLAVTLLMQPVMATIWAWLILSESLTPWQIFGGTIVLSGIFIARRGSRAG